MSTEADLGLLQHRIAELEALLEDIGRLSDLGSWEWHISEDRTVWSDSLYRIFGFEPGEFAPTYERWLERLHPDERDDVNDMVMAAYEARGSYVFDHRILWPDGTVRLLHARGRVVVDDDGEPTRIVGITYDVTDRRESEQRLHNFISDAAHELRTPVTAIQGAIELLEQEDPEMTVLAHDILKRQVDRLTVLTNNLLDLEALRPERSRIVRVPVSIADILADVETTHPPPEGKALVIQLPEGDVRVHAVPSQLERVVVNLVTNAYHHGGDTVMVLAETTGNLALLRVEDDGEGIDDDLLPELFRPFSRGRDAVGVGSGLGLAMARRLTEALGGSLAYRPRPEGGSSFRITLERAG